MKDEIFTKLSLCYNVQLVTCAPPYKVNFDTDVLGDFAINLRLHCRFVNSFAKYALETMHLDVK